MDAMDYAHFEYDGFAIVVSTAARRNLIRIYSLYDDAHGGHVGFSEETPVSMLKLAIQDKEGIPQGEQRLIWRGVELQDDQTLGGCGILSDNNSELTLRLLSPEDGGSIEPANWYTMPTAKCPADGELDQVQEPLATTLRQELGEKPEEWWLRVHKHNPYKLIVDITPAGIYRSTTLELMIHLPTDFPVSRPGLQFLGDVPFHTAVSPEGYLDAITLHLSQWTWDSRPEHERKLAQRTQDESSSLDMLLFWVSP